MATAALVAGTALLAGGQIQEGQLYKAEGKAKKGIADYNAEQLERQAESRRQAAELEDTRQVRKANIALGSKIARGGKSGVVSDVDVLADTAFQFAMDRNLIMRQSLVESQGLLGQAAMQRAQGDYSLALGKKRAIGQYMKAGGTILSGAYAYSKMGGAAGSNASTSSSGMAGTSMSGYGSGLGNFSRGAYYR